MTQPNVKFSDVTVVELRNRTKTRLRNDESRYQTTSKMSQGQKLNCPVGIESVGDLIFVSQIKKGTIIEIAVPNKKSLIKRQPL